MNYKKLNNTSYNIHIIKTTKFKTHLIKINFKNKLKKNNITLSNLLTKVLLLSSKNYKTKRDLEIETENLYNLSMSATTSISGNYLINSFNCMFLNDKYTEENMNNKSLDFLFEILLNPDIENKEFKNFELAKRLVLEEISTIKDNPKGYAQLRMLENLDKTRPHNSIGYIEDLEKITNKDLYNFYKDLFKSNLIDIFISGNIEDDLIDKVSSLVKINTVKKNNEPHFVNYKKINKRSKTIIEKANLEQSKLSIGIKLNNLTDFERKYVMNVYSFILGGSPDSKLFKNIREKHSLCYYVSSNFKPVSNILTINAGIAKDDFKKCVNLIKKEITSMTKGEFTDNDIKAAIITYINSLKEVEDNQPATLKIFESLEYLNYDLLSERANNAMNITKEDIINLSKKIVIDTIYLLEGEKNED